MAIKPWLGAIKEPTSKYPTKGSETIPAVEIELDYIYGYRAKDCRQNLFYTSEDNAVYHAAAVVIFHNFKENKQTFITEHRDDILSLAYHKQKRLVLTGELGPKPYLLLTNIDISAEPQVIKRWIAPVTKGIMCVGISPSANLGACVGMDDNHEVAVVDLKNGGVLHK